MLWRVIISNNNNAAENMAIDESIFNAVRNKEVNPTIRFYNWLKPTVSIGYNQNANQEIDFKLLEKFGYDFVRRPTGGRMVLHDSEITYSVISPARGRLSGSIQTTYKEISSALMEGLSALGIKVNAEKGSLSSNSQRKLKNPCFSSASRFELTYNHKKIVGSAQVRKDNCLLQHGSILLHKNQKHIVNIIPALNPKQRQRLKLILSKKTIAINQILETPVKFKDAVKILVDSFQKKWNDEKFVLNNDLSINEIKKAKNLISSKYKSYEWNMRK